MPELRSFIDDSILIDPDQWVVSLIAKPQGKNPEHAFLVVEGVMVNDSENYFSYQRYDFVAVKAPSSTVQLGQGGVVLIPTENAQKVQKEYTDEERHAYFWTEIMRDAHKIQGCEGASWRITAEEAAALHAAIIKDQQAKPPLHYFLPGKASFLASSGSHMGAHNCFTWAREKLLTISNQNIQNDARLHTIFQDFLGARTTLHLTPVQSSSEPTSLKAPGCRLQ